MRISRGFETSVVLLLIVAPAFGQSPPRFPYRDLGACQGEGCRYGHDLRVTADTNLHAGASASTPVAIRLRSRDTVREVNGVVLTTKPGRVVVRKRDTLGRHRKLAVDPTDTVLVLSYVGEGDWKFWLRGVIDSDEIPGPDDTCSIKEVDSVCSVQLVEEPKTTLWVKIRTADGRTGWTTQHDHFMCVDSPEKPCGD